MLLVSWESVWLAHLPHLSWRSLCFYSSFQISMETTIIIIPPGIKIVLSGMRVVPSPSPFQIGEMV
jgi:hypothetical protein